MKPTLPAVLALLLGALLVWLALAWLVDVLTLPVSRASDWGSAPVLRRKASEMGVCAALRAPGPCARVSPGPQRRWLRRGRERGDRISLGRRTIRSTAGAGGRTGSPTGRADRRRKSRFGIGGQGGDHDGPHRVRRRRRPGQARTCRQPRPAGRQPDRNQFF